MDGNIFFSDHNIETLDITRQVLGFNDIDETELISKVWSGGGEDKIQIRGFYCDYFVGEN